MPESESEQREAQVNLTEAAQDPNSISEEPRSSYAQEGKPWSMSYYFFYNLCNLLLFLSIVHLSLQELTGTLVA